jgi:hypothetical protein
MSAYANRSRREVDFGVGSLVWLKTDHLHLPVVLTRKLAPRFIGPYKILQQVNPVAFKLDLPPKYSRLHPVFHSSQLKLAHGARAAG